MLSCFKVWVFLINLFIYYHWWCHFSFGSILRIDRSHEMLKSNNNGTTITLGKNSFTASPTCGFTYFFKNNYFFQKITFFFQKKNLQIFFLIIFFSKNWLFSKNDFFQKLISFKNYFFSKNSFFHKKYLMLKSSDGIPKWSAQVKSFPTFS